jgi:hypothetical protein
MAEIGPWLSWQQVPCLFRHNPALEGIDRSGGEKCLEILSVYGLLLNCGHVFCLGIWFSVQHCGCFARSYIYEIITIILRRGSTKRFPRRTTTHKKLAGHALFVVLTAISLFPVYFPPLPFQRLKLHLDHTLTRERLEVNRSNCLVGTRANRSKRS